MGIDLSLGESMVPEARSGWDTNPRPVRSPSAGTPDELLQAHELLLRRIDEVRTLAERLEGRTQQVTTLLAPLETALREQSVSQGRAITEGLANLERHWADTAARYRMLADDLARSRNGGARGLWSMRLRAAVGGTIVGAALAWGLMLYLGTQRMPEATSLIPASAVKAAPAAAPVSKAARPKTPR